MKSKGLIITLIILLSIIIFLLIMFLVAYLRGGTNLKNGIFNFSSKSTNVVFDKEFEIASIQNINVKQDAGDIIIKENTEGKMKVVAYGEDVNDIEVDTSDGNLNIDYTHKSVRFFSFGNRKNDIIIYVPSLYADEIKIKNDYGNVEITNLENATVDIDSDCGNVEIGTIKNATVKCDYGNVEIGEVLNKCNIKVDCGNIEIDKLAINEDSNLEADLGNIEIQDTNEIYIDAKVDLGKLKINNNNRDAKVTLKAQCDCGNIAINN